MIRTSIGMALGVNMPTKNPLTIAWLFLYSFDGGHIL